MSAQLSQREKTLATIVGVAVVFVLNLVVIKYFITNQRRLRDELAAKTKQLEGNKLLFADKDMWIERDAWLKKTLPKMENEGTAGGDLLKEIEAVGQKTNVKPLEPQIGTVERRPYNISVFVKIEAKASKEALRDFLYEMQSPERAIVFEEASLEFDKEDKTQMRGKFRIAKWFAPR